MLSARTKKSFASWMGNLPESKVLLFGIISLGITLRCIKYLADRSLWLDEAFLALNLITKDAAQLTQPLDLGQAAPVVFLIVEKLSITFFGTSEYALRLFPLLCGISSLFLFYLIIKKFHKPAVVIASLGLFSISGTLVYYSSELKPYSTDVTITLAIYFSAFSFLTKRILSNKDIFLFGLVGSVSIWTSFPAIFILSGIGIVDIFDRLYNYKNLNVKKLCALYIFFILNFAVLYFISLRGISANQGFFTFWEGSFLPLPPWSISGLKWLLVTFYEIFWIPGGLYFSIISGILFIVGCRTLYGKDRTYFSFLLIPILFVLLASSLRKYPFSGRLILFIVPTMLICIVEGAEAIRQMLFRNKVWLTTAIAALLIISSIPYHLRPWLRPCRSEEIKPVLGYISQNLRKSDKIYIYFAAQYAFSYYAERYNLAGSNYIIGISAKNDPGKLSNDLDKLRAAGRAWVLFSHSYNQCLSDSDSEQKIFDEERFSVNYLDNIGSRIDTFKSAGASGYLYDLTENSRQDP